MVLLLAAAHATCPANASAVESALDGAQVAFSLMDNAAFVAATDEVERSVGCLSERVTPSLAARIHRVRGLREFVDGREAAAVEAFAAARAIDPEYAFPTTLVPPEHPIRPLYEGASGVAASVSDVPPPASGSFEFDGTATLLRPSGRATIAVLVLPHGAPEGSAYLWPGDPLFPYPVVGAVTTVRPEEKRGKRPSVPLLVTAGVGLAAAGTCQVLAQGAVAEFWDASTREEELAGLQRRANTLHQASLGAGAVALGAGVGAVFVGYW